MKSAALKPPWASQVSVCICRARELHLELLPSPRPERHIHHAAVLPQPDESPRIRITRRCGDAQLAHSADEVQARLRGGQDVVRARGARDTVQRTILALIQQHTVHQHHKLLRPPASAFADGVNERGNAHAPRW
jgi:hypothetical protein